jgi:Predicted xylanase/chitin deacetylase
MEILSGTGAVQRLDHALREMASGDGSQGRITVTFDDGTHDFITDALPVMVRLQLPATLYVSPARIGTVGFLQWDEVLEISRAGVTIGSHGLDHRSLGSLDAAELWRQVSDSRKQLEDRLGLSVESLAYPYGTMRDFNENVKVQVRKAGYRAACSSINGVNTTPTDLYALHRTKIEQGDDPIFRKILAGGLDGWEVVDRHLSFLQNRYA